MAPPRGDGRNGCSVVDVTDAAAAIRVPAGSCTTGPDGLSSDEVASRVERGLVNATEERTSRSLTEIVRANVFTRFNAILGTMFVLILVFGEARDSLFGFVLVVQRADRHRAGVPGQAHPRPARGAVGSEGAGRAGRRSDARSRSARSCSTTSSSCARAIRSPPTALCASPTGSSSTSRCSPASRNRSSSDRRRRGAVRQHRGRRHAARSRRRGSVPTRTRASWPPRRAGSRSCTRS